MVVAAGSTMQADLIAFFHFVRARIARKIEFVRAIIVRYVPADSERATHSGRIVAGFNEGPQRDLVMPS